MSNKKPNDSLQTTKQMLDELDALMEKMLSLPVNDLDDAMPFPPEVVKAPVLSPTMSATLTLLGSPALVSEPTTPASSYQMLEAHPVLNPPHMQMPLEPVVAPEPAPQLEALTNEVVPPSVLASLDPLLAEIEDPAPPLTTQWAYLPLLWINQGFDRSTTVLGGAGHGLRSQAGRMCLGVSGIALTGVAVGWLVKDWLGWNW